MFNKQKPYTTEDLNAAVTRLERLEKLQSQVEQLLRLNGQKMNQETITDFRQRYDGYGRNIASAQKYLQALQEALTK